MPNHSCKSVFTLTCMLNCCRCSIYSACLATTSICTTATATPAVAADMTAPVITVRAPAFNSIRDDGLVTTTVYVGMAGISCAPKPCHVRLLSLTYAASAEQNFAWPQMVNAHISHGATDAMLTITLASACNCIGPSGIPQFMNLIMTALGGPQFLARSKATYATEWLCTLSNACQHQ